MLHGRAAETAALASVLDAARNGQGSALVVRGEAGIGKSSLVSAAAEAATDFTVLRCVGVESEHAWSFAGLQALLQPLGGLIDALPDSQAQHLRGPLGLAEARSERPDRFAVGVAVLSLLCEASETKPVLCVVDDAHWLDRDSAEILLFAARRLNIERIAMVFTARDGYAPDFPAPGVDELVLGPLGDEAASNLLGERLNGLSMSTRRRILRAARGNPLALLELPPVEDPALAAAFAGHRRSTTAHLKQTFVDRIARLPEATRLLLLLIAAEDTGDTAVILAAAAKLGAGIADLAPAEADDLVRFTQGRFEFGHPLIRSAAYRGAPLFRRLEAHRVLAEVFEIDDHRRVLHLAAAATGPDEEIAAALERSAECAAGCGGHAVEYATFERAASFTVDESEKGRRLTRAAEAALTAGNGQKARELARKAGALTWDRAVLGRATIVEASVAAWRGEIRESFRLWMEAADHYMAGRAEAAGYPLFRAVEHAWQSGDFSGASTAADHAERLGLEHANWVRDLAIAAAGFNRSCLYTSSDAVAALRRLIEVHTVFKPRQPLVNRAMVIWWQVLVGDIAAAEREADEVEDECRESGASGPMPRVLVLKGITEFHRGRWSDAAAVADRAIDIAAELDQPIWPVRARAHVLAPIAALRGDEEGTRRLVGLATDHAPDTSVCTDTALALLDFSLGRHEAAFERYLAHLESDAPGDAITHVPVAVEAAVRVGETDRLEGLFEWFGTWAAATGRPHWMALVERCLGLLAGHEQEAGEHFERAAALHREDDRFPFETARTDLIFGEWLRRARRVNDAKRRLRAAAETFERLGAEPWIERARQELRAAGDAGPIVVEPGAAERLTPQELQVVRLAAAGLSNREIGEQLFMSPRTAGYHLYKAYPKLGVSSRTELVKLGL